MSHTNRTEAQLSADAFHLHEEAKVHADGLNLGLVTICFTDDGAFRISCRDVHPTLACGLLMRAMIALHNAQGELRPATSPTAEATERMQGEPATATTEPQLPQA